MAKYPTPHIDATPEDFGKTVDYIPNLGDDNGDPLLAYIKHYADVVLNGAKPIFVPQQGIELIKILEAMYKSAETGREVLL